jgi:hypothetical protein
MMRLLRNTTRNREDVKGAILSRITKISVVAKQKRILELNARTCAEAAGREAARVAQNEYRLRQAQLKGHHRG